MRRFLSAIKIALAGILDGAWWALCLPGQFIGGLMGAAQRGGGGGGNSAAQAEQAAAEQVQVAKQEVEKALTLQQTVSLLQRVATARAKGRDVSELADMLPPRLASYVRHLGTSEAEKLAGADAREVGEMLSDRRKWIAGVRSPAEVERDMAPAKPTPSPDAHSSAETAILDRLGERLVAMGRERAGLAAPNPAH
jgi:hypothetical protein